MVNQSKIGVLLVNLGTPLSPSPKDVFHYLNEFLTDSRVLDFSWIKRQLLARCLIVPLRFRQSAKLYEEIWTPEGSPLMVHGKAVQKLLQEAMGDNYTVRLAMRYQFPSIEEELEKFRLANVSKIIVFPLFPQYASATTGSVHEKVMEIVRKWPVIPEMRLINSYPDHPIFIDALFARASEHVLQEYDHILFSFHGLPEKHLATADVANHCLKRNCCEKMDQKNRHCYKAQCHATAQALVKKLHLQPDDYTVCFQSRLGSDPWIQPYLSDVLDACIKKGKKRVLVFCPSFVSDCLETISEISIEYAHQFQEMGGDKLQLVEGLNSHPVWIQAIKDILDSHV